MKKLKELNLTVDTSRYSSPHVKGKQPYFSGYGGGMNDSAASSFSSYMNAKKYEDEDESVDEEDDIMPENILRYRIKKEKGYDLNETLKAVNESYEFLDIAGSGLKYGARALKAAGKAATLSIPIVDTIAGSLYLTSGILSFKEVSDVIIEKINVPENTFAEALASPSESDWIAIINTIENLDPVTREELENDFEDLLHNIKSFIVTISQTFDSLIASGVSLAFPPGFLAAVGGANMVTAVGGFVADIVPFERFVLDATGKFASVIEFAFDTIFVSGSEKSEKMRERAEEGGPIFLAFVTHPVQSIRRLGQFYTAIETGEAPISTVAKSTASHLSNPSVLEPLIDKAIASYLAEGDYYGVDEDIDEEEDENMDEFSGAAAAGGGPATPLGTGPDGKRETTAQRKEREKKANIYAEQIRRFQSWQHKTSGRIK